MRAQFAITGMGVSRQGRQMGITDLELRRQAVELALDDAGLQRDAIDAYFHGWKTPEDLRYLGLSPTASWQVFAGGQSASASIQTTMGLIATGQAETAMCCYGIAPSSGYIPGMHTTHKTVGASTYGIGERYNMIGAASTHALHVDA